MVNISRHVSRSRNSAVVTVCHGTGDGRGLVFINVPRSDMKELCSADTVGTSRSDVARCSSSYALIDTNLSRSCDNLHDRSFREARPVHKACLRVLSCLARRLLRVLLSKTLSKQPKPNRISIICVTSPSGITTISKPMTRSHPPNIQMSHFQLLPQSHHLTHPTAQPPHSPAPNTSFSTLPP